MEMKSRLSAAVIAAILAGAGSEVILSQFLNEKEGNRLSAYQDAGGVWTICRGITRVQGAPVRRGMRLTAQQCDELNRIEAQRAIDWVKRHVQVPLTEPQIAGIASFCPYNIGPGKCFSSTFYRKLNAGDKKGACAEIKRWIFDGGKDCRKTQGQANGCYGQVERRVQEAELTCWGLDK
ncbi:lysozyme [Photorhabdus cinerea]|uniref:Lysozyme n=1 Tax=Photorhabdus cinerea TaxID=471575 RepID=A0A7X5TFX6_9GAMM|nr:lysozyme [Photorhabdus cinerea]NHB90768.1 lysozyme [Photorhabdus cinerea]